MTNRVRVSEATLSRPLQPARRWGDLLPRAASGLVMIALALASAFAGGHWFSLFWLTASVAVLWEWQHLVGTAATGLRFASGALALAAAVPFAASGQIWVVFGLLAAGMAGAALMAQGGFRLVSAMGVAYAGALLISVSVLRASFPGGLESILWLFAVVWGTDIFAYFGGRLIGGPKLWPRLSPSKTWSGFLVGIAAGSLAGVLVKPIAAPFWPLLLVGLLAGAVSQGGDLFESTMKRRYGVKDASHLIPGHGGVMDRLDGFIAAALLVACLGVVRFGVEAAGAGLFTW